MSRTRCKTRASAPAAGRAVIEVPDLDDPGPRLTRMQALLVDCLRQHGPGSAADVATRQHRDVSNTATTLRMLAAWGVVQSVERRVRRGRARVYYLPGQIVAPDTLILPGCRGRIMAALEAAGDWITLPAATHEVSGTHYAAARVLLEAGLVERRRVNGRGCEYRISVQGEKRP